MFGRVKCSTCGVRYNAATGTMIEGSKLDAREIILMSLFIAMNIPAETIASVMHIHKDTVRNWRTKFRSLEGIGA